MLVRYFSADEASSATSMATPATRTRDIGELVWVEGDQGCPVHQSLSCDHPVEQFPLRVAGACDNVPVGLCGKIIERQRRNGAQHRVEPCPENRRLRRLPIDAALQLDACDN